MDGLRELNLKCQMETLRCERNMWAAFAAVEGAMLLAVCLLRFFF